MIANFGFGVMTVTFLVTLYSVFAAIYGESRKNPAMVESTRRAMLLTWPLLSLTAGVFSLALPTKYRLWVVSLGQGLGVKGSF